jgi:hypothetical protein
MAKRFLVRAVLFELTDEESVKLPNWLTLGRVSVTPVAVGVPLHRGVNDLRDLSEGWEPSPGLSFGTVTAEEIRAGLAEDK